MKSKSFKISYSPHLIRSTSANPNQWRESSDGAHQPYGKVEPIVVGQPKDKEKKNKDSK